MTKFKVFTLLLFVLSSSLIFADVKTDMGEQNFFYHWGERLLGPKVMTKIWGPPVKTINLPSLPSLTLDGKKIDVCHDFKNKKMKLSPDEIRKYDALFLTEVYGVIRDKDPTVQEYSQWLNTLEQGASREGIYRALVLDGTYRSLEYYIKRKPTEKVLNFTLDFMKVFLGEEIDLQSLENLSFHSIKRIVVERVLTMVDYLCHNEEELYDWYAVFSTDLAHKWPSIWSTKTRQNNSALFHREWAKAVDEQNLKSELIIKLHQLYNFLQK